MRPLLTLAWGIAVLTLAGCEKTRETVSSKVGELLQSQTQEEEEEVPLSAPVNTVRLTDQSYEEFISQRGPLVVVVFSADWCGPCRQLGPVLDKVAGEFAGRMRLGRVDVDHSQQTANLAGVRGIPDVRMFRDGRDVTRFTGSRPVGEVRELIRKHLPPETAPAGGPAPAGDETPAGDQGPPAIRRMEKDWRPSGVEKRGT